MIWRTCLSCCNLLDGEHTLLSAALAERSGVQSERRNVHPVDLLLLGLHHSLERWIARFGDTGRDRQERWERGFDYTVPKIGILLRGDLRAVDRYRAGKRDHWKIEGLSQSAWNHSGIGVGALGRANDEVRLFLGLTPRRARAQC